jgi:hypothetical protein
MDNINDDMAHKPDLPGDEDFVVCYIDSHFNNAGKMSTMTNPPLRLSPLDKRCVSFSVITTSCTGTKNNEEGCSSDVSSNDPPMMDNDTLSPDDALLLTMSFPHHSFMVKYIHEYATAKGFLPLHKCKNYFHGDAITTFLPGDGSCSSESNPSQDMKYPKSVFFVILANLKAASRVSNAVFILIIFGIPARRVLCLATNHQTFHTIIN